VAKGTRCWRIEQPLRGLRPRLAGEGFRPIPPCRWLEDQAQFSSCTRTPRGDHEGQELKKRTDHDPRDQARTRSRVQRLETHRRTSKVVTHGGRRCCQLPVRRVKLRAIALQLVRAVRTCVRGCGGVPVRGVRRAVEARNLTRAIAEARDLPQISLVDAAEVVVLAADDPRTIFQSVGWTTGRSVRARRTQPHARRGAACADCSSWAPARETGASRRSRSSRFSPRATGRGSSDHSGGCSRRSRTIPGDGRLGRTTKREPGTPRRLPLSRVTRQPQKRSWSSRTDEIPTSGPNSWTQSAIAPGGGAKSI
jgi:hypothetical protein